MNIRDEIAITAYELYVKSGCIQGREFENWLEAERIVLARLAGQERKKTEKVPITEPVMSEKEGAAAKKKIKAGSAKTAETGKKNSGVKKETGEIKKKKVVKKKE